MRSLLLLLCLSVSLGPLAGQSLGGLPGRLEWSSFGNDTVNFITTPATVEFARRAQRLDAGLIELRPLSLGSRLQPIDIVVQPVTVVSNGFVGLEPFRSYLYATPPQSQSAVSTNAWVDALAIHEYRHVEQLANLRRGLTKFVATFTGDAGLGFMTGLSVPNWFSEGDAVFSETVLTYAGRGRTPAFTALQRAQAVAGRRYAYAKARNGSLRTLMPDHYRLGYALVAHGRLNLAADPWPATVAGAGSFTSLLYPFSLALKRETGFSTRELYRVAYDSLATAWKAEIAGRKLTPQTALTPALNHGVTYATPLPQPDGDTLYAQRRSLRRVPEIVRVDPDGRVKSIVPVGANLDGSLHARGGQIVWTQLRLNPTHPEENYSVIMRYDVATNRRHRLTNRTHYFSPGLSATGDSIVVAETRVGLPARLALLKSSTGERTLVFAADSFDLLAHPRFTDDGRHAVAVAKRGSRVCLYHFAADGSDSSRQLTPWSSHVVEAPLPAGDFVYFSADYTGTDQIFRTALDGTGAIEQLSEAAVSAGAPAVGSGQLYFVETTAAGNPIVRLDSAAWLRRETPIVEPVDMPRYAALAPDSAGARFRARYLDDDPGLIASATQVSKANLTPYRHLLRGYSVYSYQPLVDQTQARLTLFGGNILGDLATQLTGGYNYNERRAYFTASATLARTYPWFGLTGSYRKRRVVRLRSTGANGDTVRLGSADFGQLAFGVRALAPLQQINGAYRLSFRPEVELQRMSFFAEAGELPGRENLSSLGLRVSASRIRSQAPQHIVPRDGQVAGLAWQRGFGSGTPTQITANAGVFFPGLLPNHGVYAEVAGQRELDRNAYKFSDFFRYARGYTTSVTPRPPSDFVWRFSADYHFPIFYPDVGAAGVVYLKRLRASAWVDLSAFRLPGLLNAPPDEQNFAQRSVGFDLTGDFTFFNVEELPVGLRFAYRIDDSFYDLANKPKAWAAPELLVQLPIY